MIYKVEVGNGRSGDTIEVEAADAEEARTKALAVAVEHAEDWKVERVFVEA